MNSRIFSALLLLTFLSACASPAPTIAPATEASPAPETETTPWWREAVFYEIFVRSFHDSNGDGIGDLNGITQKLEYLDSLGINAIWLMPIHPSPSYHGYDVTDYYEVNPQYGTMDDLKNLLNEAHKRDMHIIIDLVLNHTSSQHPWFVDANTNPNSPYRDFYVWSDEQKGSGWHAGQEGYYFGFFWEGMPDLNYNNPAVTEEMFKVTDFWLDDIGVDGFRVDAAKHLIEEGDKRENTPATHEWFKGFYEEYKKQTPQAYAIAEVYGAGAFMAKTYYEDGQFDQIFNFEFSSGVTSSANSGSNIGINSAIKFAQKDMPNHNFATFLTNHDQNRAMSVFSGDANKAKLAAFLMLTAPGTPYIYYGEEIGMQGVKPDEDIRLPMQWTADEYAGFSTTTPWRAPATDYPTVNVAAQTGDPNSLLEHYRRLIALRKEYSALQTGELTLLETSNTGVYASLRADENGTFLILANLKEETISEYNIPLAETGLAESTTSVETVFGAGQAQGPGGGEYKPFEQLSPYQMVILKFISN